MNLVFSNGRASVAKACYDLDLIERLDGLFISFPVIFDGMGEKAVECDCNKCKRLDISLYAEHIIFKWKVGDNEYEDYFEGLNSYFIQNMMHKLLYGYKHGE